MENSTLRENGAAARRTAQTVTVTDRRHIAVSGVEDVISFDENNITLRTALGVMTLDGQELHIQKLNPESGEIAVEGTLDSLLYLKEEDSGKERGGRLKRLLR